MDEVFLETMEEVKEMKRTQDLVAEITAVLEANGDPAQAGKMAAYMQNRFEFAGIPKPELKELIKPFLKDTAKEPLNWDLVSELWDCKYREAQYIALEYLQKHRKQIVPADIDRLKNCVVEKSWWETVDTLDAFIGDIVRQDNELVRTMLDWASSENIWLRRVAIDYQQEYKENTDTETLEKILVQNLGSNEFFINKAIGWSLRDYSKVNPEWVAGFVQKYGAKMAPLSVKEATKYL